MPTINLSNGQRAQRKLLITVAEWTEGGTEKREILGTRTEDSSIELNADIATSTDIRGITYTDVNKTEPQQSFDPFYILGGSALSSYLASAMLKNDINAYNGVFTLYIIAAFMGSGAEGYYTVKHTGCSIIPTAIGGDSYTNMPIEVHYSNNITEGVVDKLADDFTFTPGGSISGSVVISKHILELPVDGTATLTATTIPEGETVSWNATSTSVATVTSDGVLTAEGAGNTVITASITVDGVTYTDTCTVIVTAVTTS
jgi:hypothetical protein